MIRNKQEQRIKRKISRNQKGERPREELEPEGAYASSNMEEQRSMALVRNKTEMVEMFAKLENVIKAEILNVRTDMGHLLRRVEEAEELSGKQAKEISELKAQVRKMQNENRMLVYKMEEQEDQSRRQNLRTRDMPEQHNEDLGEKMRKIFNPILGRREDEALRIDRVHRVRKPPNLKQDSPRDVIVKFHSYEDKEKIWKSLR